MATTYKMVSVHQYLYENEQGDVVDAVSLCTDWCHQQYCEAHGLPYEGWNGCHEVDAPQWCAYCEENIGLDWDD